MRATTFFLGLVALTSSAASGWADDADQLAKKLSNPVASMISVPFQFNADFGLGTNGDAESYYLNIQPVIPITLNANWNLISRTIAPVRFQDDLFDDDVFGLGDVTQSFFLTPSQPGRDGLIWGIGPVLLMPTATDSRIGTEKWGAGPTGLVLTQRGRWTVGTLMNHIWSFAGDDDRADVNSTFLQPFLAYALGGGQTINLDLEATYDWTAEQWTVPTNLSWSKVFKVGDQAMSVQVGGRYYFEAPEGGPDWGLRSNLTFLFPQ